ncbi:MAG: glycosyl hydrolase family 8 [Terrimicrobiaceae bacterium]|nr:glycosyl hydrolase family 8 [Terrimicrobiaceae bacterium]
MIRRRRPSRAPDVSSAPRPRRRRHALLTVGGLAILAALAWLLWPRDPYALPRSDWRLFKDRFLAADGRIVDDGNGGISHTEGQGYGMLLAVAFRDRPAFDRMWSWTLTHLKRKDDFLFSWEWTPADGGRVADANNATDGDLLLAWALVRAFREWKDYKYRTAAAQITTSLFEKTTVETYLGLQLLPGVVGFQSPSGVVLNPSYYVFPALTELGGALPSDKWKALRGGGATFIRTARFGKWSLAPDWALVGANWVALAPDHDPVFGYNAIRVPLHIAWDNPASPLLEPFAKFWAGLPTGKPTPASVDLQTNTFGPYPSLPGMLAVRQLTLACTNKTRITVRQIPPLEKEEKYYSASLKLLTKLAIRDRFAPKRN